MKTAYFPASHVRFPSVFDDGCILPEVSGISAAVLHGLVCGNHSHRPAIFDQTPFGWQLISSGTPEIDDS